MRSPRPVVAWMLRVVFLLGLLSCVLLRSQAAELIDLGQGLSYLRIHSWADSEAALLKAVRGGPLVLDLRYATVAQDAEGALRTALAACPAKASLFVLVSPATPPIVARTVEPLLTLGAPGSVPMPKVIVETGASDDRKAYDAAEKGMPLAKLISGKIEKERFDEATLVHEFKNGNPSAEPPLPPDPTAPKNEDQKEPEPQPRDRVLQRAVHLHRASQALRSAGS